MLADPPDSSSMPSSFCSSFLLALMYLVPQRDSQFMSPVCNLGFDVGLQSHQLKNCIKCIRYRQVLRRTGRECYPFVGLFLAGKACQPPQQKQQSCVKRSLPWDFWNLWLCVLCASAGLWDLGSSHHGQQLCLLTKYFLMAVSKYHFCKGSCINKGNFSCQWNTDLLILKTSCLKTAYFSNISQWQVHK